MQAALSVHLNPIKANRFPIYRAYLKYFMRPTANSI